MNKAEKESVLDEKPKKPVSPCCQATMYAYPSANAVEYIYCGCCKKILDGNVVPVLDKYNNFTFHNH